MSFLPDFLPFGQDAPTPGPMSPNLPGYQTALANQFTNAELQARLDKFDPGVARAYRELQTERVNLKGSAPYTAPVIARGISAAGKSRAYTPEPEGNLLQNVTSDIGALTSLLNPLALGKGLVSEIAALPDLPEELARNLSGVENPLQAIGAVAKSPGIRFIPGSYIASTLAPGGPGLISGAYEHPLFTALDILPYASKAARLTPVVKAAEGLRAAEVQLAAANKLVPPMSRIAPIRTAIENFRPGTPSGIVKVPKRIGMELDTGLPLYAEALEPNALGRATQGVGEWVRKNKLAANLFDKSNPVRVLAQIVNRSKGEIFGTPKGLVRTPAEQLGMDMMNFATEELKNFDLTPADRAAISAHLTDPARNPITPELVPRADAVRARMEQAAPILAEARDMVGVPFPRRTEYFSNQTGKTILDARAAATGWVDVLKTAQAEVRPESLDAIRPIFEQLDADIMNFNHEGAIAGLTAAEQLAKVPTIDYAAARKAFAQAAREERRHIAAAWQPTFANTVSDRIVGILKGEQRLPSEMTSAGFEKFTIPDAYSADDVIRLSAVNDFSWMDPAERQAVVSDIQSTFQRTMADAKDLPTYIPRVNPDRARRALSAPGTFDYAPAVDSLKDRASIANMAASTDPYMAISHQGLQLVQRDVSRRMLDDIIRQFGATYGELHPEYLKSYGGLLDEGNELVAPADRLYTKVTDDWKPFDPEAFLNPSVQRSGPNTLTSDTIMLPKAVHDGLSEFAHQWQGELSKATNPLMRAFRASVLTYSLRFYLNNIFGGMISSFLGAENPVGVFQHMSDAIKLTRDPDAAIRLRNGEVLTRSEVTGLPSPSTDLQAGVQWEMNVRRGDNAKLFEVYHNFEAGKAVRGIADKIQGFSGRFNAFNDGAWQTMLFLEGFDNALTKGLSRDEAIRVGVENGRRVFEYWDTLTPTERTIIKSVFPFYGFTRNLLKFTLQYPTTHPTRLAILSSIAKAEQEDFGSGLPQRFAKLFWLGPVDSHGKVQTINVGGMNPFQDVASYASLIGFVTGQGGDLSAITRNVNPFISTGLKQLGVDTAAGTGDLYPDLEMNPITGEMKVRSSNPLVTFANSVIPQSSIITNLAGMNGEFKAMLKSNPEAAGRTLWAAAGVPTYLRQVDVPKERMKAEITRYTASRTAQNEALKSGNWSGAEAWASLRPFFNKLRTDYAADPEAVANYLLTDDGSALRALKAGVTGSR